MPTRQRRSSRKPSRKPKENEIKAFESLMKYVYELEQKTTTCDHKKFNEVVLEGEKLKDKYNKLIGELNYVIGEFDNFLAKKLDAFQDLEPECRLRRKTITSAINKVVIKQPFLSFD